ncbi:hypothetical protein [Acidovorax sp. Leaf73]|uniref:hypothetical protein n=1 Tax=Acidovorax sp. Leaf73 TaxID=2876566 RepID=UPI001E614115|nr:hypothetical protein [Acidovorax sp. Leaf73]
MAGARVLGMPWAQARRRQLLASRVDTTLAVVSLMRRLQKAPRVLVSALAVGFYGASPNASMEPLDEIAPPRPGEFQSDLCAVLGHGRQHAPWIHLADAVGLVRFALAHQTLQGPVNAVAPKAVTQASFARALAAAFGRRVWLRRPGLPLRALLGALSTLLLDGQNAVPSTARVRDTVLCTRG